MSEEVKATYQQFFVESHPAIKLAYPSWTPQQITTEIGRRWSLKNMTIESINSHVFVNCSKEKFILDGCGFNNELVQYLESYRKKYGADALYKAANILKIN